MSFLAMLLVGRTDIREVRSQCCAAGLRIVSGCGSRYGHGNLPCVCSRATAGIPVGCLRSGLPANLTRGLNAFSTVRDVFGSGFRVANVRPVTHVSLIHNPGILHMHVGCCEKSSFLRKWLISFLVCLSAGLRILQINLHCHGKYLNFTIRGETGLTGYS